MSRKKNSTSGQTQNGRDNRHERAYGSGFTVYDSFDEYHARESRNNQDEAGTGTIKKN